MPPISTFWLKIVMAVTGIIFALFVLAHMLGNLKVFAGAEHFDAYARWLRAILEPVLPHEGMLWLFRAVLLASVFLHAGGAVVLEVRKRRARGTSPRRSLPMRTLAVRTMLLTGIGLLAFVLVHVLDLTLGVAPVASEHFEAGSAYANLVASLKRPAIASVYVVAMIFLALHLGHGLWTAAHDLGTTGQRSRRLVLWCSGLLAIAVTLGNIGVVLAIFLGFVR
jgi:succinate dehydrogenase / fumarate reductase, cytochrome b subunit